MNIKSTKFLIFFFKLITTYNKFNITLGFNKY